MSNFKQVTATELAEILHISVHGARKVLINQKVTNRRIKHGLYEISVDSLKSWQDKKAGKFRKVREPVSYEWAETLDGLFAIQDIATKFKVSKQYVHHLVWYLKLKKWRHRGVIGTFLTKEDVRALWQHLGKRREKPPLSVIFKD